MNVVEREICDLIYSVELSYYMQSSLTRARVGRELFIKKNLKRKISDASKNVKRHLTKLRKMKVGFLATWESHVSSYRSAVRIISENKNVSDRDRVKSIFKWVREEGGIARMNAVVRPLNEEDTLKAKDHLLVILTTVENDKFDSGGNVYEKPFALNYFGPLDQVQAFKRMMSRHGFYFDITKDPAWRDSVLLVHSAHNNPQIRDFFA